MRHAVVLRPAPGADRTIAALVDAGLTATALPLFAVRPVAWIPPRDGYDAVVLTSAQAVLHAGPGLAALGLPIMAVGAATAAAASAAGLSVVATGTRGVAALLDAHTDYPRLLHLAGHDRIDDDRMTAITVYAADPLPVTAGVLRRVLGDSVVLVHSARAARRLDEVTATHGIDRARTRVAVIAAAVAAGVGTGWDAIGVARSPTDAAIIAVAVRLAD